MFCFVGQKLLRMAFDIFTDEFVELLVVFHQSIIFIIERIEEFLFVTDAKAFLRSVLPCGLQTAAAGGILLVGTFHHIGYAVGSQPEEGVAGAGGTFTVRIVIILVEAAVEDFAMQLYRTHYIIEHFSEFHAACQFAVNEPVAQFDGRKLFYLLFRYPFGTGKTEKIFINCIIIKMCLMVWQGAAFSN